MQLLFASQSGSEHFSFLHLLGIPESYAHIGMSVIVTLLIALISLYVYRTYPRDKKAMIPDKDLTFRNIVELSVEQLLKLFEGILGDKAKKHLPFLGSVFIYIFISNLFGLIPGFVPPTDNINTNLPIAIAVFVYYNYDGIKENGLKEYLKHFMGPVWWLAVLMIPIEILSHLFRMVSLSLRLFGNITGDHMILAQFSDFTPFFVPVAFLGLGLFVSFMQAFIFSFLAAIYIDLASAHEH